MAVKTVFSTNPDAREAVGEIARELYSIQPVMVLFFASFKYEQNELAKAMKEQFAECPVFGCSTAGEIVTGKMLSKSCVAMAFDSDTVADCIVRTVENVKTQDNFPAVFRDFESYYDISMKETRKDAFAGIVLIDGMSKAEEGTMERINSLTSIPFIGGAAGDDLHFRQTWVYCEGEALSNAAVLALIKPAKGYCILKTQSFKLLNKKLVATKVDAVNRMVIEFDEKPATEAYAEALGILEGDVNEKFMSNPLGLMIDGEPFVRSPQQIIGKSIVFYCAVEEGMELELLESSDIIEDTKAALNSKLSQSDSPSALVNFNCILRTVELDENDKLDEYGDLFSDIPTVGFSTYGEEYIKHINQTATMLFLR